TYSSGDLTPKGTGNQYWRLAIGWGGTFYQVSNGGDMAIAPGVKTNATVSCTSTGAYYRNVSALTNRYVFKTLNAGVSPTGTWVFFELGGASTTVSSVSLSPANPTVNNVGTVTATLSAALPTGQAVYLRYSTDNFATSTVTSMTGSGTSYTAYIGTQALNAVVKYYVFTSGSGLTIASADADLYTINWNAGSLNGGSNYSYTVAAGATLLQSLLIDFGPADGTNGDTIAVADANGKFWNNITKTATTDPQKQLRNTSGIPLTGYSLNITASSFITNGKGNGGLRTPYTSQFTTGGTDTNLAIGTATEDFFYAASGTSPAFKISGLNPNKKYMFKIFGSRAGNSARNAQYSIVGAATTVGNLDNSRTSAYNSVFMLTTGYNSDTNNGYQLTSGGSYTLSTPYYGNNLYSYNTDYITPLNVSGSGQFTLTMSSPLYAQNCFINCMKMEEYKGEQTITLAATGTKTVGDADYSPATASSTLTIGYASSNSAVATIVSGQIHIVGVGTTTITASQAGDATYEAATNVTQLLTVNAAAPIAQTITFGALSAKVYGDINFSPGASASSGLTVSYTSSNTAVATIASGQIHIVGVGTSTITASQAGDAAYFAATNATQTLTVNSSGIPTLQQSLFFDFGPSDGTNGDNTTNPDSYGNNWNNISNAAGSTAMPTSPAAGSSFSNLINSANSATTYGLSFTVAGFTSNGKQNGGLLSPTSALGEFNTATATEDYIYTNSASNGPTVKITGLATHKKYRFIIFGYRNTANTRTSNYTIVGTDSVNVARTLNGTLNTSANVSTCYYSNFVYPNSSNEISLTTVTPTAASDNFAYINCMKLEEYKGGQAITFGALPTKNTSDANFAPGATTNSALTISYISSNTAVATIVSGQIHIVGEGTCTITASQVGDATYDAATDATQLLTVTNKTAQTITFSALSAKTVGDATFNLTASASSTLTVSYSSSSTAVATISGSTVTIVGAGTTDITASQSGNGTYAAASNVTQTLTVNGAGTPTLNQSLYFDFGPNDVTNGDNTNGADANGHYWNNINSTSNNATVSSLKNVANSATAYTLVLTNAGFTTNGKLNGGLLSSDPAKLGEFAVNTATEDYFYTTSSGAFKITGLDIAKQYKFKIFGSRTNATDRTTQYSIQGTGSAVVGTLQTSLANLGGTGYDGNNSSIYTTDYIYPNNSGEISVSASIMGSGVYAYINAMKLEEYTTPNVDVVSIAISGSNISATAASSQMNVVYTPSYATHKSITWSVDNTSNAIIDANGLLTPKKNSTVNVTASLQLNGSPISTTKQITISNQLTNLYLSGTATSNGDDVATALSMNASPTLSGIPNGVFEIATTLNASGTLHFYTTQDVSATIYGTGGTAGTVQSGGAAITPTLSGKVLIRV
ncbi:MAG: Ig-like domain-containing protein, partial [Paludibacter sp.]